MESDRERSDESHSRLRDLSSTMMTLNPVAMFLAGEVARDYIDKIDPHALGPDTFQSRLGIQMQLTSIKKWQREPRQQ